MTQLPTRPRATHADLERHPDVLAPVNVTLRPPAAEPLTLTSRVLDVEADAAGRTVVTVDPPEGYDPAEHRFDATLTWTYPLGRMECPVATAPARRRYGRVWLLRPTAQPVRRQERAYFRARLSLPGALEWTELVDDDPEGGIDHSIAGTVADLSEGGLLLLMRTTPPPVSATARAIVDVDGEVLAQDARIVRHVPLPDGVGVGVAFTDPSLHGDRIRNLVFASERRRLRL